MHRLVQLPSWSSHVLEYYGQQLHNLHGKLIVFVVLLVFLVFVLFLCMLEPSFSDRSTKIVLHIEMYE